MTTDDQRTTDQEETTVSMTTEELRQALDHALALLDFGPAADDCTACATASAPRPDAPEKTVWPHDECPYHHGAFEAWDEARRLTAAVFDAES